MRTLLILAFMACVSCTEREQETRPTGEVSDVRITTAQSTKNIGSNGDPIGGAIVGGLIAGKTGAVVGAIAEESGSDARTLYLTQVEACGFTVSVDGHKLQFRIARGSNGFQSEEVLECTLMRAGDKVKLREFRGGYTWNYIYPSFSD